MSLRILIASSLLLLGLAADAVNITTAGTLKGTLSPDESAASTLQISGQIDATDIEYLSSLTSLKTLDLSGAVIVEYNGEPLATGAVHSDPNRIPNYAFVGSRINSIALPQSVTSIGEAAFAGSSLQTVYVSSRITDMEDYVFADCPNLETASINTTYIPKGTFRGCVKLKSVGVTEALQSIGDDAFAGCSALPKFSFYKNLTSIGSDAFFGTALEMADLSRCNDMKTIGDRAFAACKSLTTVYLPKSLTSIGKGVFFDNIALETIAIPEGVTDIPDFLFKGALSLGENVLNSMINVTTIGDYAFMDMTAVTNWRTPDGLEYIGTGAMEGMTGLAMIDATKIASVPSLGENVWAGVNQSAVNLSVPQELESEFESADQWKEFNLQRQSGVNGIDNSVLSNSGVEFYIEASTLHILASTNISNVVLYDMTGRALASALGVNAPVTAIDLSNIQAGVLIVTVETDDNQTTTVKFVFKG